MLLDCGHAPTWTTPGPHEAGQVGPADKHTTGTAHTADGRTICQACAEREEVAALASAKRHTGYLSGTETTPGYVWGGTVTTWTGAILLSDVRAYSTRSGFGGHRWYLRGRAADGSTWYGSGTGLGMFCNIRRTKPKLR